MRFGNRWDTEPYNRIELSKDTRHLLLVEETGTKIIQTKSSGHFGDPHYNGSRTR